MDGPGHQEDETRPGRRKRRAPDTDQGGLASWASALDADRREAVATVGHELRTPLSIILALCSRLQAGGRLTAEDAHDLAQIRAHAHTLARRIDDLMLVARLEAGEVALEPALLDVARLTRRCAESFASLAEDGGVRLEIRTPARAPALVDEEKLVSIVANLMSNAVRHAPPDGVVRCSLRATRARLVLEVADSGPGFEPGVAEHVFDRYQRGRQAGRTGLGLSIVQRIVTLHGGTITAGAAPEGGALFRVELPRLRAQLTEEERAARLERGSRART